MEEVPKHTAEPNGVQVKLIRQLQPATPTRELTTCGDNGQIALSLVVLDQEHGQEITRVENLMKVKWVIASW